MNESIKEIFDAPGFASKYEEKTEKANWLGPELLFGLSYRNIRKGEKILDLGIGTGLCSELFHSAGLRIYGMDISSEMLKIAGSKKIAEELKEHDLTQTPYPYADSSMDHIVCGGVMHIFSDPTPIIREASRILRKNGSFAFCCLDEAHGHSHSNGPCKHQIHAHPQELIKSFLAAYGFTLKSSLGFLVDMHGTQQHFRAYIAEL